MNSITKPHLLGLMAGLFLAAGMICSVAIVTAAWVRVKTAQTITVKGSARKNIRSDLAIWSGSFTAQAGTLLEAQQNLKRDAQLVREFLAARAVSNVVFTPIHIQEISGTLKDTNGLTAEQLLGYRLTQSVRAEFSDVDQVTQLGGETAGLVAQGVMFTAQAPEFIYTKAGEAKVEMLAEATRDARTRAAQIAQQGGRQLGPLDTAEMGVIQIAPIYSGQTSWEGINDTTALEKTITAVVTATFALQ
jgi:hypothetical protein